MPSIPETLQAGLEHHRAGRLGQAEQMYRTVLGIHPRHAGAVHLLGLIAYQIGRFDIAEQYLGEAVAIDGFHAPYRADLGEVYRTLGKLPEAIASYREALKLNPDVPDSHTYLGTLLLSMGDHAGAAACFREALKLDPLYVPAHEGLGDELQAEGDLLAAQACFETAVRLDPTRAEAYLRLGTCQRAQGNLLEAIACYQKAQRLDPGLAEAHYALAQARLSQGEFASGWRDFEWRSRCMPAPRRSHALPPWTGGDPRGKRLLIQADDDLGDTLQFIRYVPLLVELGAEIVLDVPLALAALFEQSGLNNILAAEGAPPTCDAQIPLWSLPKIFGTALASIPARVPYLTIDQELVRKWREKLSQIADFKVGIVWQGDPRRDLDRVRSIPLVEFEPLSKVPGVRLISLQNDEGLDQLSALGKQLAVVEMADVPATNYGTLTDMAAIMASLDLVITCDADSAQLAGALGINTWVALSTAADWRWLQHRSDSPWYPTMRLFRQSAPGVWPEVFGRMASELAALAASR